MQRRAVVGELGRLGRALARSRRAQLLDPRARVRAAAGAPSRRASRVAGQRRRRARPRPRAGARAAARRGRSRRSRSRRRTTAPKPRRKSIGTPITSATSASLSAVQRAREKNSSWSAGTQPAREAVEEDRDAELLGERAQRLLAMTPVEVRAGHDHRALGVAQQRDRALERVAVGRRAGRGSGSVARRLAAPRPRMKTRSSGKSRNVGPECGVTAAAQRLVDEAGDLGRRPRRSRRASSAGARTARGRSPAASPAPSASPARGRRARASASGSAAPSAIALMPFVTPGPAVSAATPGCARDLRPALGGERGG